MKIGKMNIGSSVGRQSFAVEIVRTTQTGRLCVKIPTGAKKLFERLFTTSGDLAFVPRRAVAV